MSSNATSSNPLSSANTSSANPTSGLGGNSAVSGSHGLREPYASRMPGMNCSFPSFSSNSVDYVSLTALLRVTHLITCLGFRILLQDEILTPGTLQAALMMMLQQLRVSNLESQAQLKREIQCPATP